MIGRVMLAAGVKARVERGTGPETAGYRASSACHGTRRLCPDELSGSGESGRTAGGPARRPHAGDGRDPRRWHGAVALPAADAVVGAARGEELPLSRNSGSSAYANLQSMDPVDDPSIVVSWTKSYMHAAQLCSEVYALARPLHLLEASFREG